MNDKENEGKSLIHKCVQVKSHAILEELVEAYRKVAIIEY